MIKVFCFAATWTLLAGTSAFAGSPELVTDRPDQTESASVVPRGAWQLEAGALWSRQEDAAGSVDVLEAPGTLLRLGLGRRAELRLGWDGLLTADPTSGPSVDGAGDASLGAKIAWGPEHDAFERALLVTTSVPVGDDELTSDRFDPEVRLALARPLGDTASLGLNLGVGWATEMEDGGGRTTEAAALYTVAAGFALSRRTGAFLELFGELPLDAGADVHSVDGGLTWLVAPTVQLDFAAGAGLSEAATDWFVGAGVSFRRPD